MAELIASSLSMSDGTWFSARVGLLDCATVAVRYVEC